MRVGQDVAGVEVDEARAELVDHGPAGLHMRDFERREHGPDHEHRHAARQLGDDEEDRQQVDEPERAERLDEGLGIEAHDAERAVLGRKARRLEGELDRDPQHVEIGEVHDLAVEIGAPVAVDHAREEQAGDQEEVGHAEGLCERDQLAHPACLARGGLDAERRMHHHHHDDAEALGVVDPVDAWRAGLSHIRSHACHYVTAALRSAYREQGAGRARIKDVLTITN